MMMMSQMFFTQIFQYFVFRFYCGSCWWWQLPYTVALWSGKQRRICYCSWIGKQNFKVRYQIIVTYFSSVYLFFLYFEINGYNLCRENISFSTNYEHKNFDQPGQNLNLNQIPISFYTMLFLILSDQQLARSDPWMLGKLGEGSGSFCLSKYMEHLEGYKSDPSLCPILTSWI